MMIFCLLLHYDLTFFSFFFSFFNNNINPIFFKIINCGHDHGHTHSPIGYFNFSIKSSASLLPLLNLTGQLHISIKRRERIRRIALTTCGKTRPHANISDRTHSLVSLTKSTHHGNRAVASLSHVAIKTNRSG